MSEDVEMAGQANCVNQASNWLDEMPPDIQAKIALEVLCGDECEHESEDGLHLAQTSETQRKLIGSLILGQSQGYMQDLVAPDSVHEWSKVFVGQVKKMAIVQDTRFSCFNQHLRDVPFNFKTLPNNIHKAPYIPLLEAPELVLAEVPEYDLFLTALRSATSLSALKVYMRGFSRCALLVTLEQRGASLLRLELVCQGDTDDSKCASCPGCPMSICGNCGWTALTRHLPRLTYLSLACAHITPSSISSLVQGLPSLSGFRVWTPSSVQMSLSEEDIQALRRVPRVTIGNFAGGIDVCKQIGRSLTEVQLLRLDQHQLGKVEELVHCTHLERVSIHKCSLKAVAKISLQMPKLTQITVWLGQMNFKEVESAATEALNVVLTPGHSISYVRMVVALADPKFTDEQGKDSEFVRIDELFRKRGGGIYFEGDSETARPVSFLVVKRASIDEHNITLAMRMIDKVAGSMA